MQRKFDVYADPGHAWGKVPLKVLTELGLSPADFTAFSYRRGDAIYLEEDGDLTKFANAYKEKTGVAPEWREHHCDNRSKIRGYYPNTVEVNRWLAAA